MKISEDRIVELRNAVEEIISIMSAHNMLLDAPGGVTLIDTVGEQEYGTPDVDSKVIAYFEHLRNEVDVLADCDSEAQTLLNLGGIEEFLDSLGIDLEDYDDDEEENFDSIPD